MEDTITFTITSTALPGTRGTVDPDREGEMILLRGGLLKTNRQIVYFASGRKNNLYL